MKSVSNIHLLLVLSLLLVAFNSEAWFTLSTLVFIVYKTVLNTFASKNIVLKIRIQCDLSIKLSLKSNDDAKRKLPKNSMRKVKTNLQYYIKESHNLASAFAQCNETTWKRRAFQNFFIQFLCRI